jgi:hypothetical protein
MPQETQPNKLSPVTTALFIGFMFGIIFYSIAKNNWGLFTVIPLFFAYKLIKNAKLNH